MWLGRLRHLTGVNRPVPEDAFVRGVGSSQLAFGAAVLMVLLLTGSLPPEAASTTVFYLGATVILMVTTFALLAPTRWRPSSGAAVMLYIDVLGVGLMHAADPHSLAGLLWVAPVMLLATYGNSVFLLSAFAAIAGFMATQLLISPHPFDAVELPLLIVLPTLLVVVGLVTHYIARRMLAQQEVQRRQARLLAQALAQARAHEVLLETLLETVSFGVVLLEQNGEVRMKNRAQREFDLLAEKSGGRFAADGFTPLDPAEEPERLALSAALPAHTVVWCGAPERDRVALAVTALALESEVRPDGGVVIVSQDITEQLGAIRMREDLIASLSHELRTPLTSVIGYLELALDDDLPPVTRARLEIASRSADRLMHLISQIVAAAGKADDDDLDLSPVNLCALVDTTIADHRLRAQERNIEWSIAAPAELWVRLDASRIRQVLDNVVGNAVKYNHQGGHITVTVSTDTASAEAVVSVRDTGPGISVEELPRVFERHFRSERVRASTVHGSGLGLYFAQQIVHRHAGSLVLLSEVGRGTEAIMRLPLAGPDNGASADSRGEPVAHAAHGLDPARARG